MQVSLHQKEVEEAISWWKQRFQCLKIQALKSITAIADNSNSVPFVGS
jgi:hypothetical protein